jgi:uncharacterized protein YqjF (DUF2071 family)
MRDLLRRASTTIVGYQRWHEILFLHWPVPADALRPLVDPRLAVDTFEGQAYVSLTPFTVRNARLRFSPALPLVSEFHELNLRTYVRPDGRGKPGVWFFSLDAASALASGLARASLGLPYVPARIERRAEGASHRYRSERWLPRTTPASFEASWSVGEMLGPSPAGSLEHFLVERYALYSVLPTRQLVRVRVRHPTWLLKEARLERLEQTITRAANLALPDAAPIAHFSDGVHVELFLPERVA